MSRVGGVFIRLIRRGACFQHMHRVVWIGLCCIAWRGMVFCVKIRLGEVLYIAWGIMYS